VYLSEQSFDCGHVPFLGCVGRLFGDLFYNMIIRNIFNGFLSMIQTVINQVVQAFLMTPLQGMSAIFQQGLQVLTQPGVNPIVALAQMGTMYINFASNLWITILGLAVSTALIPYAGPIIFALMAMGLPLLMAWLGIMVGVGFVTAYYIPILPYMIFTFGTLAWLISVIEAMVAAPIVALGVTHPEGHDAFGKAEAAIMILMNVFLRPALMIIGYISGIALCYVGVWLLNAGFDHAIGFIQSGPMSSSSAWSNAASLLTTGAFDHPSENSGGYTQWSAIYAYFFGIIMYTSMYLVMVQQAFTLISVLPDKVLRWIGGNPESIGQEAGRWGEEAKGKVSEAGKETSSAQGQMSKTMGAGVQKGISKLAGMKGKDKDGSAESKGVESTPPKAGGEGEGGEGGGGGGGPSPAAE
jgi:defect-in-organelle-trafficking protein DotA